MHHKSMESQDRRSLSIHSSSFLFFFLKCYCFLYLHGRRVPAISPPFTFQSWASVLLQNGGDWRTTAAQRPRGLVGLEGWAGDGSESKGRPGHSRYVTQTTRFLIARRYKSHLNIVHFKFLICSWHKTISFLFCFFRFVWKQNSEVQGGVLKKSNEKESEMIKKSKKWLKNHEDI